MQPYFFPYAGYFRLLAASDIFVIFDCVQFPRRGRVHRCWVEGPSGKFEWLTLPLQMQPRDVLIRDLEFARDARGMFDRRLNRLPWIASSTGPNAEQIRDYLHAPLVSVVDYLETGIRLVASLLDLEARIIRSSSLGIRTSYAGQERVIAIASALGASHYVNAPGGRMLYEPRRFREAGMELRFLQMYDGAYPNLLRSLMTERAPDVRSDVFEQSVLELF